MFITDDEKTIVRDRDQRVYLVLEAGNTFLGVLHASSAFKCERLGYYADRQSAHLAGGFGNDRRCAGASAAAHAGGDEHHVCAFENLTDLVPALLGTRLTLLGIAAYSKPTSCLVANPQTDRHVATHERLRVRVNGDVLHLCHSIAVHTGHSI